MMTSKTKDVERVKQWRKHKLQEGAKSLTIWVEPDTKARLDALAKLYQESMTAIIDRSIKLLYELSYGESKIAETRLRILEELALSDSRLDEIKRKVGEGIPVDLLRDDIIGWIQYRRENKWSWEHITDLLNSSEIPTLSGKGIWNKATLYNLTARQGETTRSLRIREQNE